MSGLGPTAEFLSFAWPKERNQRKGHPMPLSSLGTSLCLALRVQCMQIGCPADLSCAPKGLNGVFRKGIPALRKTRCIPASPLRADPSKPSGARRGIRGLTLLRD